ncbi:MAG TPA: hypothetical protein VID73_10825, partial [Ktedonobacterales bacterium]
MRALVAQGARARSDALRPATPPNVMDGATLTRALGGAPTPLSEAVAAMVSWLSQRMGVVAVGRTLTAARAPLT